MRYFKKIYSFILVKFILNNKLGKVLIKLYKKRICRLEEKADNTNKLMINSDYNLLFDYTKYILSMPTKKSEYYKPYIEHKKNKSNITYIAYYLTQYHPNPQNDLWWGKGSTEWDNVAKAVPQFEGHIQPRLPGELGFYDLRIKENLHRQIELAKNYGIDVFCFYYYWFNGERLLERPLNLFLSNSDLYMPFCICWANENWTRRYSGDDPSILITMTETVESYQNFIYDAIKLMKDERYYCISGKPVLIIYRPSSIPEPKSVLEFWRNISKNNLGKDLYIIAVQERYNNTDWCKIGFDAETEFQPTKHCMDNTKEITKNVFPIRKDFSGRVYDYKDCVVNRRYLNPHNKNKKVYLAVTPMWDNTARRNHRGTIFHNSTPDLYEEWLSDVTKETLNNKLLDEPIVFINAWNEWGEGAYLEPDRYFGYAYLEATVNAKYKIKS